MKNITISITDARLLKLEATATRLGISLEDLILIGVEIVVNQPEDSFEGAIAYVLNKNAELYQRLQ